MCPCTVYDIYVLCIQFLLSGYSFLTVEFWFSVVFEKNKRSISREREKPERRVLPFFFPSFKFPWFPSKCRLYRVWICATVASKWWWIVLLSSKQMVVSLNFLNRLWYHNRLWSWEPIYFYLLSHIWVYRLAFPIPSVVLWLKV